MLGDDWESWIANGSLSGLRALFRVFDKQRGAFALCDVLGNDALAYLALRWDLVHHVQHHFFENRAQAARTGLLFVGPARNRYNGIVGEPQLHLVEGQQLLILFEQRIPGFRQDPNKRLLVQFVERRQHWKAADKFRNETVLEKIFRLHLRQKIAHAPVAFTFDLGAKPDRFLIEALSHNHVQSHKSAAADEQDVAGIHSNKFLMRMFAAPLRWDVRDGALDELQQRLLDTFTGDIAGDRRTVAFAADLIDLIDVDDPAFGPLDIVIGRLEELQN